MRGRPTPHLPQLPLARVRFCEEASLAANTELLIGDPDGSHVLIRPVARRHPGLFDHRDANRIACECRIAAGAFRGEVQADLRSEEFSAFLDALRVLQQAPGEAAALTPEEGRLVVSLLSLGGEGRVRVSGEAIDEDNRLQFAFEIDAGALGAICESLERTLAVFPVVAAPEV